jgi:hypothetical protein
MKKKSAPVNEVEQLLAQPEVVAGFTVTPWTLADFARLYPPLKAVARRLIQAGLTLDNLDHFLSEQLLTDDELLLELVPVLAPLLALSLGQPEAVIQKLPLGTVLILLVTLIRQNLGPLKNFWSLIPTGPGVRPSIPSP